MSAGHGKCVQIIHVIGDQLCQLGTPMPRPDLGPPCSETVAKEVPCSEPIEETPADLVTLEKQLDNVEISENDCEVYFRLM